MIVLINNHKAKLKRVQHRPTCCAMLNIIFKQRVKDKSDPTSGNITQHSVQTRPTISLHRTVLDNFGPTWWPSLNGLFLCVFDSY
jgi:hypothetical protein